jgi:FkbM family methyltransferase
MMQAEQTVVGIVQSVLPNVQGVGAEEVAEAARRLGAMRNTPGAQALAFFCQHFLLTYKNQNYDIRSNGERWVLNRMAAFRPKTVFDVGADEGFWTMAARAELSDAHVHAFEIVDSTCAILARRVAYLRGLTINRFGLSDRSGTITMHAFDASNTFTSHVPFPHGSSREIECRVVRGDDYMREHGIDRIDFLKVDVEGAEHLVLQGFDRALDAGQIDVIQFEYGKVNIMTHFLLADFYNLLESKGYRLGKIYPDRVDFRPYDMHDEDFIGPNYLAVRRVRTDIIGALMPGVAGGIAGGVAAAAPALSRPADIARNEPCPCGSGKKYKKCCGATAGR